MSGLVDFDEVMLRIRSSLAHMWHTARDAASELPAHDVAHSRSVIDDRMDEISISLNQLEELGRTALVGAERHCEAAE